MTKTRVVATIVAFAAVFALAGCSSSAPARHTAVSVDPTPAFSTYLDSAAPGLQGSEYPAWQAAKAFCHLADVSNIDKALATVHVQSEQAGLTDSEGMTIVRGAVKYICPEYASKVEG